MNFNYASLNGFSQPNHPHNNTGNNFGDTNRFVNNRKLNRFLDEDGPQFDPIALGRNIRRSGSHIYFYDSVDPESQLLLEMMLRAAIRDVLTEHVGEILGGELPESVTIHLNSPGGVGSSGLALYDYIKTSQIPITCVVEGICASAATLIMLACPVRVMSPNSEVLMHQCSWGAYGDNRFMQDLARNAEGTMQKIRSIYMKETNIGADKPEKEREAFIQHLLEHDWFLSAEECERFGITSAHDDDDEDVELSEERVAKLQEFVKKLAVEQKAENAKAEAEAKKAEEKLKAPKDAKAPKKATAKKSDKPTEKTDKPKASKPKSAKPKAEKPLPVEDTDK